MVTRNLRQTFENGSIVESVEVVEAPPGTFRTTRRDAAGIPVEERAATPEEVTGLTEKQDRGARLAAEQAVRDINPASINNIAAARTAIAALQDLMLLTSMTSDD